MSDPFLYLASQSPRRAQLLGQLGVQHALLLAAPDEDAEALEAVLPGEAPSAYVQRVTGLKLDAAVARHRRLTLPAAPILCADTTVAFGRTILGKPVITDPNVAAVALSAKSLAFGDLSTYYVRLAGGIRFERSDDFAFQSDLVTFRCIVRGDGILVDQTGAVKHFIGNAA